MSPRIKGVYMSDLPALTQSVQDARERYLMSLRTLTSEQGSFKPDPGVWSAAEITEHLVHAEYGGINGIWKALDGVRRSNPPWTGDHTNKGLSIEQVIERTWKLKEDVPAGAEPRLGGPLAFWLDALESCQFLLEQIAAELAREDLEGVIYPHPLSGPLDARQRFEFLRFHMDRHLDQVERLKAHPRFP
jgi:hypothetical protein